MQKDQNGLGVSEEGVAYTLDGTGAQATAYGKRMRAHDAEDHETWDEADVASTRSSHSPKAAEAIVGSEEAVACECCPVDILPDSRRYQALGDAVTVNVAEWVGRGILEAT